MTDRVTGLDHCRVQTSKEALDRCIGRLRDVPDRSSLLEARLAAHRSPRASQEDRQRELANHCSEGINRLKWDFVNSTPGAAVRWDDIGALELSVEEEVRAALAFSTGVLSLDIALGGGIPSGAIEIYGAESVGKTSLLITMIKSAQESGKQVALCPTEYFDQKYFEDLGVDLSNLLIIRGLGEDVLIEAGRFIVSDRNRALFIDSATGVRPIFEEFDNWRVMLGTWLSAVRPRVFVDSAIVMTNQVRQRKSEDPRRMFAGGTDSTAKKLSGMFDARLEITRDAVTENEYSMVINVVANTLRQPSVILTVPVVKGKGVKVWRDIVRVAAEMGILDRQGSWYYYEEVSIAQGEEAVAEILENNSGAGEAVLGDVMYWLRKG